MKHYLILLILLFTSSMYAQGSIEYITPEQLVNNIKSNTSKATVIQFWIPNCANAKEIVNHYNELEEEYSADIDFYFIGITNKETLVSTLIENTGFKHKIYIATLSVNEDITMRRETFATKMCNLLKLDNSDFITMYLNKKGKVTYYGDAIDIEKSELKKVI